MIKSTTFITGITALMALLSGCGTKNHPELYRPGDIPTWRMVDRTKQAEKAAERPVVLLKTSEGTITVELFEKESPNAVQNFLHYVETGFYDGLIFHRVIPGFMVQGGAFTSTMVERDPKLPKIKNEAGNGIKNTRGTVAMARTSDLDSANAQFYFNLLDNAFLNGDGVTSGYAVFGRVIDGMNVIDTIATKETQTIGTNADVPVEPITIISATRIQ